MFNVWTFHLFIKEIARVEEADNTDGNGGIGGGELKSGGNADIGTSDRATMVESIRLVNLMAKKAAQQAAGKFRGSCSH